MSRYHSYLNSAVAILNSYKGEEPFASFLKKYFAANKKFGSKDRKQVSHLCYCYFRLGKTRIDLPVTERILTGLLLCSQEPNELLAELKPEWNEKTTTSVEEKYAIFNHQYSIRNVFPWQEELSSGIDFTAFNNSHFVQPDLFLRIRPGHQKAVKQKLQIAGIAFTEMQGSCIALPNSTKADTIIELDKEVVIQDYSSQQVYELMQLVRREPSSQPLSVWDCCAASGGKSILAKDILGNIALTVSDVRESILLNLKKRFSGAGIGNYKFFVTDLSASQSKIKNLKSELIICDAPCTGSGTWSRTPEQLFYFEQEKIEQYASLQKKIAANAASALQPGGYFLYVTCSVFKKENEEVANTLQQLGLNLIKQEVLAGYDKKADTMFAALLQKPV